MLSYQKILFAVIALIVLRFVIIEYLVYKVSEGTDHTVTECNEYEYNQLIKQLPYQVKNAKSKIRLKRSNTSHLFGLKILDTQNSLDLTKLNQVIKLDTVNNTVRVGGNTNLLGLIKFLQKRGYGLKVIPDMDHLTIGGLYAGIGGGARTFKCGAFFNTVQQVEVLTGNGDIVIANQNQNSELFELLPSTLGTLGYALSLWLQIEPIKKYVYSRTFHFNTFDGFITKVYELMQNPNIDFLDGTIFSNSKFVVIVGTQTDNQGNYKLYGKELGIPYDQMVEDGYEGVFEYYDYIYRWDVDGYYSFRSKDPVVRSLRNKLVRKLLDKRLFTETKLRKLADLFNKSVLDENNQIQECVGDFMIPLQNSKKYFEWYDKNIALYPLYMCPIKFPTKSPFVRTDNISIDFGVGYGVMPENVDRVQFLRQCMLAAYACNGDTLKYNSIYTSPEEFWSYYDPETRTRYTECKTKYDTDGKLFSITDKLVKNNS